MVTEPTTDDPGSSGGGRSRGKILLSVVGALVAVGLVVVLALIGLASHKVPLHAAPPTTLGAPTLAAGKAQPSTVTYAHSTVDVSYGGMQRSYVLIRPATTSKAKLPVVVVLHGRDVTPTFESERTDFTSVAGRSILVYPAGYQESWNAGNCCAAAQAAHVDDAGFVRAVIAQVKSSQPDASSGKVYLAGYSNGGKLALQLACQFPGDFQAVAVYGATDAATCPNRPPANVLMMDGTADTLVPASSATPVPEADGFVPPSFLQEVQSYRQADGCNDQAVVTTVGTVTLTSWVHCTGGTRTGQAIFTGQTHEWPVGNATTPSGEGVMWAWFKALGAAS